MHGERWKSMDRYADNLQRYLESEPHFSDDFALDSLTVEKTGFIRPARAVLRYLPWLKTYANDLYFSRFVKYPRFVRRASDGSTVGHILDHSYGHLLGSLKARYKMITCHDLIPLFFEKDPALLKLFRYSVARLEEADLILADSRDTRKDLASELGVNPDRVWVVPLGVDLDLFRITEEKERREEILNALAIPAGKVILHVGNGLPYKNFNRLLKVFAKVLANTKGQRITLVNVGRFNTAQKNLARELAVDEHIIEMAGISDGLLVTLYNIADVYLQPSLKEGFGFTVLEAMACGTPVIVSKGTSLAELSGKIGIYVDPLDVDGTAEKIFELLFSYNSLLHPSPGELRIQAEKFSWQKTAQTTTEAYKYLINHNKKLGRTTT